jgi:hypothetical protein
MEQALTFCIYHGDGTLLFLLPMLQELISSKSMKNMHMVEFQFMNV